MVFPGWKNALRSQNPLIKLTKSSKFPHPLSHKSPFVLKQNKPSHLIKSKNCSSSIFLNSLKYCTDSRDHKDKSECVSSSSNPEDNAPGRHGYPKEVENQVNKQIDAELSACFGYLAMACYFGRSDVAWPGCQGFFMLMHSEEHEHAMLFVNYQLRRGGTVRINPIQTPSTLGWSIPKAFKTGLEFEKKVKEELQLLFNVAEKTGDLETNDLVSSDFMYEQNRSIDEMGRLTTLAQMAESKMGEYLFDQMVFDSFVKDAKGNHMYTRILPKEEDKVIYR